MQITVIPRFTWIKAWAQLFAVLLAWQLASWASVEEGRLSAHLKIVNLYQLLSLNLGWEAILVFFV